MNTLPIKIHSLSHLENTASNEAAIRLATTGRGRYNFDTSWGHVVTKIIDLLAEKQLDYTTYSGEKVPVFGTHEDLSSVEGIRKVKAEIMTYYGMEEDDSGRIVVDTYFQQMAGNLHNAKLKQHDKEALTARRDAIKKIIEDVVVQWEENIPVPTVLERMKNLADKDKALAALTPKQLEEEVLWIGECDSFWADTPEEEKMEYTISKRQLATLVGSLVYLAIDYPDHARIEQSASQIKNRIMTLVQVSREQIQALNTKNNDIPGRKRTNIWKKVFSLDNN
jgi:hypothetical protein